MTVNILISTIDERIKNVKNVLLSPRDDIKYIVSHQYTDEAFKKIPPELHRDDVTISQIKGKGISKSRNNAIKLATGDIAILADDDLTYKNSYIDILIETFNANPDIDIALFKIKTGPGEVEYKSYPASQVEVKKVLCSISTPEMAFNLERVKEAGVCFDERFGAGQELIIGSEETIFVEDCLKKNLNVVYIPEYITEHPYLSTIKSIPKFDKRRVWVTGAYDCRTNGPIALIKAFLGTIKILPILISHKANPLVYFYHRISAVIYILRTNKDQRVSSQRKELEIPMDNSYSHQLG